MPDATNDPIAREQFTNVRNAMFGKEGIKHNLHFSPNLHLHTATLASYSREHPNVQP
jgi:hypothetical protein